MNKLKALSAIAIAAGLSACGAQVPNCSSAETHDLVYEITVDEFRNVLGPEAENFTFNLEMVRTLTRDEDIGYFECAADLVMSYQGESETAPIEYTVTSTDDKEHFYVEVFGL